MIVLSLFKGLIEVPGPDAPLHHTGSLVLSSSVRDAVIAEAAAQLKVFPSEIFPGRGRSRQVVHARQLACHLLHRKRRTDGSRAYSLPEIGRSMGLDHSSVLWGIRAHIARRDGVKLDRRCHRRPASIHSLSTDKAFVGENPNVSMRGGGKSRQSSAHD